MSLTKEKLIECVEQLRKCNPYKGDESIHIGLETYTILDCAIAIRALCIEKGEDIRYFSSMYRNGYAVVWLSLFSKGNLYKIKVDYSQGSVKDKANITIHYGTNKLARSSDLLSAVRFVWQECRHLYK